MPERLLPRLTPTDSVVVPLPLPLLPDATVTQLTPLEAVHVQPAGAVTADMLFPPSALTVMVVGAAVKLQPLG